jgi:diacylglycerol kinase (ATP)
MTRALVVVNPVAGRGRARGIWARAADGQHESLEGVECLATDHPGHARQFAREAAVRGVERVIAVGGDGTVSEVAGGLAGSDACLGIIPAGTGNDFARALGLPTSPHQALRVALDGPARSVDLGAIHAGDQQVSFVNVAGCGFDAEVVRRTTGPRVGGALPYLLGVVRTLAAFRPRPMRLLMDGRKLERSALGIAVAIAPSYGGGMRIAPGAVLDDGLFDVCLIGDVNPLQILGLLPRLYRGTHITHPAVEMFRCRELIVEPLTPTDVCCQADGELLGRIPATFSLRPNGLRCVGGWEP